MSLTYGIQRVFIFCSFREERHRELLLSSKGLGFEKRWGPDWPWPWGRQKL